MKKSDVESQDKKSFSLNLRSFIRFFENLSSSRKLALLIFTVLALTTIINTIYFTQVVIPRQTSERMTSLMTTVNLLGDGFEDEINNTQSVVITFATNPTLKSFLESISNKSSAEFYRNQTIANFLYQSMTLPNFFAVDVVNSTGHELLRIEATFINKTSRRVIPDDELQKNRHQESSFKNASRLAKGNLHVSELFLLEGRFPIIRFTTPLHGNDGGNETFKGVLNLEINVQPIFNKMFKQCQSVLSPKVIVAMVNEKGYYLFNSYGRQWTILSPEGNVTIFSENEGIPSDFLEGKEQNYELSESGFGRFTTHIIMASRVNIAFSNPEYVLYYIIEIPQANVLGDLGSLQLSNTVFLLVTGMIVMVIAIILGNYLVKKPIDQLIQNTKDVTEGKLRTNVLVIDRKDEIGQLAQHVNEMAKSLRQIISSIVNSSSMITAIAEEITAQSEEVTASAGEVSTSMQNITHGASSQAETLTTISEHVHDLQALINEVITQIHENTNQIIEVSRMTRTLALNATIEASRTSGTHHGGFMVIAENVQQLAKEVNNTAKSIRKISRTMTTSLQEHIQDIAAKIESVASLSEEHVATAEEVTATMSEIVSAMETMTKSAQALSENAEHTSELLAHFET